MGIQMSFPTSEPIRTQPDLLNHIIQKETRRIQRDAERELARSERGIFHKSGLIWSDLDGFNGSDGETHQVFDMSPLSLVINQPNNCFFKACEMSPIEEDFPPSSIIPIFGIPPRTHVQNQQRLAMRLPPGHTAQKPFAYSLLSSKLQPTENSQRPGMFRQNHEARPNPNSVAAA